MINASCIIQWSHNIRLSETTKPTIKILTKIIFHVITPKDLKSRIGISVVLAFRGQETNEMPVQRTQCP